MVPTAVLLFGQPTWARRVLGLAWGLARVASILVSTRGLSGMASGLSYRDNREPAQRR